MPKEKPNNQNKSPKYGYTIISDYFLEEWTEVVGTGPSMLYIHLLKYCYEGKDLAWPTLATLSKKMQLTPKTITKYHQVLAKYGLIKKITKRKTSPGGHMRNIYQLTPINLEKNTLPIGNIFPYIEEKITPDIGKKLPTNHNNLNHTNITTTNSKKDAVVAAVDFKKLKEKGEEKMIAVKERLEDLDLKEEFIEQLLKDYPARKIEEKLDLLLVRKNIKSPAGWLVAALKNDYQNEEQESPEEESVGPASRLSRIDSRFRGNDLKGSGNDIGENGNNDKKILSKEEAIRRFKLLRHKLMAMNYSHSKP